MSLRAALYYELTHGTNLQPIIGTRAYPAGGVPQNVKVSDGPYLTYQIIDAPQSHHQTGNANCVGARVQFNCIGKTPNVAQSLRAALKTDLDQFRGPIGNTDYSAPSGASVTVRKATLDTDSDFPQPPNDAAQRGPFSIVSDFLIWFVEA